MHVLPPAKIVLLDLVVERDAVDLELARGPGDVAAVLVEDGKIVEQGRHEELIRNDGLYASLYRHAEVKEGT